MLHATLLTLQVSNRTVRCDAKKLKAENIQGQQQPVKKEEAAAQPKKRAITYEVCML